MLFYKWYNIFIYILTFTLNKKVDILKIYTGMLLIKYIFNF